MTVIKYLLYSFCLFKKWGFFNEIVLKLIKSVNKKVLIEISE